MNKIEAIEDTVFVLYIIPLIVPFTYFIYSIISKTTLSIVDIYLSITKNPLIFIIGIISICIAIFIDFLTYKGQQRKEVISNNSRRLQTLAFIIIPTSFISAWIINGLTFDFGAVIDTIFSSRFSLIFPLLLLMMAISLTIPIRNFFKNRNTILQALSLILIILSPVIIFGGWRMNIEWTMNLSSSFIVLIIGIVLLVISILMNKKE